MKKLILFFILFLYGCSDSTLEFEKNNYDNVQEFNIISGFEYIPRFISEIEESGNKKTTSAFKEIVIKPIWDDCFNDGEYLPLLNNYMESENHNIEKLLDLKNEYDNSNLDDIVKRALEESSNLLVGTSTNVCILPSDSYNNPSKAVTVGKGKIVLFYNEILFESDEEISSTIAHEYFHSVNTESDTNFTLLDYILFEGKAEYFKKLVYPQSEAVPIDPSKEEHYWDLVNDILYSENYTTQQKIMFGGGDYPPLYGYGLGYRIMDEFIKKNPDIGINEWKTMKAEDILNMSDYFDN
ncbi:DUF2268 domain-containing putative Zn-dependent protease [Cytobacillus kochii]|uniref:DUF2268 domain-containing protein n=1 Tax=Cytobacillus kochii TaxID=859143 RepID=A0A248TPQ9_9BACI|nr:DUF2268 domain-containing putative Zn-dependent protease [Cytobacillus kochii]ASV70203.1 hypothetical protein CKF48_23245 [Cytobacillus kochii]